MHLLWVWIQTKSKCDYDECTTCTKIEEMYDEAEPQILRDYRSDSLLMALGGKMLKYNYSHKDASNPNTGVSTTDFSN